MTQIEQMIKDLCPQGVEFKKLGDLGVFENTGVNKKSHDDEQEVTLLNFMDVCRHKYIDASIPSMVVTAPDRKIEQCNVLKDDIFITPSSETIDEIGFAAVIMEDLPNVVYSYHIMRYRLKQPNTTTAKFIRYLFEAPVIRKQILKGAKGLTRFGLSKYQFADIEIPLPPLEIQKKIVECLDKFSALAAELQAELQMRRKQYEYYRTQLLTPHSDCNSATKSDDAQWEWKTLGEIGTFTRGRRFVRTDIVEEGQPCIHYGDMYTYYGLATDHARTHLPKDFPVKLRYAEKGDVIIVGAGENDMDIGVGCVWEGNEPVAVHDACYIFKHNQNPRYISHYLRTLDYHLQIKKSVSTAKICAISPDGIAKAKIAIPSLAEQARIVSILDKFEALTTSLSDGIPAEQAAQQKRYEYYRDLLLTFDRKAV